MKYSSTLLFLLLFACSESEEEKNYTFSGEVVESSQPLPDAKIKLRFYNELAPLLYSRIESVDLVTDGVGKYSFTKKIENVDSYDAFSVSLDEEYLKNCGSFQDKDITEQYLYIDGFDNKENVEACSVSIVKIIANKLDDSSGNLLTITRSWQSESLIIRKIIEVIYNDKEIKLYFPSSLSSVELTFSKQNGTGTSSETKQINLASKATTEVPVDF